MSNIVHWSIPVLWDKDEESSDSIRELGIEPEQYEGEITICVNDIMEYNAHDKDGTTMLRFHGHSWHVNIPYGEFKEMCGNKLLECNSMTEVLNHY